MVVGLAVRAAPEWVTWVVVRRGAGHPGPGLIDCLRSRGGTRRGVVSRAGRVPLVAAERGAVEEAVLAHHELKPAGGRRVGQEDRSVLERVGVDDNEIS